MSNILNISHNTVSDLSYDVTERPVYSGGSGGDSLVTPPFNVDLAAWIDPSIPSTITTSGVLVNELHDPRNENIVFSYNVASPVQRPTYQPSDTLNGLRVIRWSGGQRLNCNANFAPIDSGDCQLICMFLPTGAKVINNLTVATSASPSPNIQDIRNEAVLSGTWFTQSIADDIGQPTRSAFITTSDPNWMTIGTRKFGNLLQAINNSSFSANTNTSPHTIFNFSDLTIGSRRDNVSNGCLGLTGEMLFYNRALSSGEYLQVETYLQNKWGPF